MRYGFGAAVAAAAMVFAVGFGPAAWAHPDHGNRYGWSGYHRHGWYGGSYRPGWSYGYRNGWYGSSSPPGWSRGLKRGWGGRSYPPGWYRH
jgi:hypothetical protein